MSRKTFIVVFLLVAVAQWWAPGSMIWTSEATLNEGEEYWFRTQPIDPTDPFRGKYITLYFEHDLIELRSQQDFAFGDKVYVVLRRDANGFAQPVEVYEYAEEAGDNPVMVATISTTYEEQGKKMAHLRYSFEKFYLEESKASEAERIYWDNRGDTTRRTYAVVSIDKRGNPVLKDVMINDESITDVVRRVNATPH